MAIDKLTTTSFLDESVTNLKIAVSARASTVISSASVGDLSDVDITTSSPSSGQTLVWDNANSKFIPGTSFSQSDFDNALTASDTDDLSEGTTNLYYTDARADARVALVIDSAPATLNTLNELASALGDDANFSTTVTNSIADKLPLAGGTMTGNLTLGDNVNLYLGDSSDASLVFDGTDTTLTSQGELILNGQTGVTIDCNNVTNQPTLFLSDMGAGNTGILLKRATGGSIMYGQSMDHSRPKAITGTNKSLGFFVAGGQGNASYAAFDFAIDANASSRHPAVMGVRSPNNNALLFQGEQSDSTVVFSVDYDGNVATSGTVDGRNVATDGTKLDTIETNAKDDQTITAGAGLTGGGTGDVTLSHAATSSQVSLNNSGRTYIQDITLDTYGHITSLATATETVTNTNLTHTGEVTGSTSLTISDNIVDEANLKVSNAPTDGYFLSAQSGNAGGLTWAIVPAGYTDSDVASYLSTNDYDTSTNIIAAITDSAPGTLDTLNELAAALGDDDNFSTTVTNSIATKLPLAGGTMTGDINFGDNDKASFGASNNLEIYYDGMIGSNMVYATSPLFLASTGNIWIGGDNIGIGNPGSSEYFVQCVNNGEVKLYHDNAEKLATTATGIDVTGNVVVSGTVDGRDVATDGTKLDTIATNADVTDTTNVTAAGALMDSEVTNLAQVKAFDSSDYATSAQGTTADAALPKAGGTITGDILYNDNVKAKFGASNDLEIYHDGSNSYIHDRGVGNLYVKANVFRVYNSAETAIMANFVQNSAVSLYHDATKKFETTATGIDVTGTATMDGLTVDGNITTTGYIAGPAVLTIDPAGVGDNTGKVVIAGDLQVDGTTTTINSTTLTVDDKNIVLASGSADAAAANGAGITVDGANATITYDGTNDEWDFNKDVNVTGTVTADGIFVDTDSIYSVSGTNRVGINKTSPATTLDVGGSIFFSSILRSTTGGSASSPSIQPGLDGDTGMFWPAVNNIGFTTGGTERIRIDSSGNVGIGTSAPASSFNVTSANGAAPINTSGTNVVRLTSTTTAAVGVGPSILFEGNTGNTTSKYGFAGIQGFKSSAAAENYSGDLAFFTQSSGGATALTEAMRIDSLGNLLVGTTTAYGTTGTTINAAGLVYSSADGDRAGQFDRTTSDGELVRFSKAGTTVGSIGTHTGDLYIGTGDTALRFYDDSDFIYPVSTSTGTSRDGVIDLGFSGGRFKDLYLLGNVNVDGTVDGRDVATDGTKLDTIATNANDYTHPTHPGDDASIDTGALTGAVVISDLDFNVTTDTLGHVTDANATVATRTLTLANLGYTGETNATADQTKADIEGLSIELPAANLTGTIAAARLSTATTQVESDDSTKIATTAYVTDKITTLIGGAPSTLNDLNELAAAINDDANYNTTLTTALGTKLPLAGGAMTGPITTNSTFDGVDIAARDAILTSTTTTANAALPKAGGVMTGDLQLYKATPIITLQRSNNATLPGLSWQGAGGAEAASIKLDGTSGATNTLIMSTYNGSTMAERLRLMTSAAGGIAVTGTISVTGTVDGVDIAARDAILTSTTTTANAALPKAGGTMTGNLTVSIPDSGGAPATTAILQLNGYEGRGAGIKIKDSVNSAANANSQEWFMGTGYSQSAFNIGYSSTGSQTSYTAQNKLTITTAGDVGIGTASPQKKLEVTGDLQLDADNASIWLKSGVAGTAGKINWTYNSEGTVYASAGIDYDTRASTGFHLDVGYPITLDTSSSTGIKFITATVQRAVINNSGLGVTGNIAVTGTVDGVDIQALNTTANAALPKAGGTMTGNLTVQNGSPRVLLTETGVTNTPTWWSIADGGNYNIRLNNTGVYPLDIVTNSTNDAVIHINVGYNTNFAAGIDVTGNITVSGTVDGRDVAADGLKLNGIETGATADQTAAQILTAIKTVDGTGSGLDADLLDGQHGSYYQKKTTVQDAAPSGATGDLWYESDTGSFYVYYSGAWVDVAPGVETNTNLQINSLGVGTAASGTAGEIRATNDVTAYYSDERLKDFHGNIDSALDKVNQLNGYYFTENETAKELGYDNDKRQVGVSAQEVEAVLPEVVAAAPISDEYLTVKYEKLAPLFIEAIKEIDKKYQDKIDMLMEEIKKLKGN